MEELRTELERASEEERKIYWQNVGFFWMGFILTFFDLLALMIHGKCMRQLVMEARNGDDRAFALAVQIDRTVLSLKYFQNRINRAQLSRDYEFLDSVAYRIRNPAVRGKIRRRTLWLFFAVLDSEGLLNMPAEELLEMCEEAGVYGKEFGVGDANSLGKRRREYFRNRGTRKYF